ncbi:MAG TPA: hypothetical protein VIF81_12045 [Pyrinomonadaceae bacterium]
MFSRFLVALCALVLCLSSSAVAQDEAAKIDKSRVPSQADKLAQFAPAGWKIEEQVAGDLNGDSVPDYALKLVEDKPEKNSEGDPTERGRALVLALATTDGKLKLAGVADSLLQCTRCGGAFYGVVESPANVKIEKGVVIIEQDHGSREVTDTTYRFRFDRTSGRFVLIGFDLTDVDRATASTVTETINYLTGVRVVTLGKGDKDVKTRTTIPKQRIYLEDASADDLESAAYKRLKL